MKKMRWTRSVVFFVLLFFILSYIFNCFSYPKSYCSYNIQAFYEEPKNTIDGLVIGTSVIPYAWQTTVAFEEYGITVYQVGTSKQAFGIIPEYLDVLMDYQDIKYVVIDVHGLRKSAILNSIDEVAIRALYNDLKFNTKKFALIEASLDYVDRVCDYYGEPEDLRTASRLEYYVPLFDFHNRWIEGLYEDDFVDTPNEFKATMKDKYAFQTYDLSSYKSRLEHSPNTIDDFQKSELQRLFNYLDEKQLPALFVNIPSVRGPKEQGELDAICDYIAESGYDVINYCTKEKFEELNIDITADFCNTGHMNSKGGKKITLAIGKCLADNFEYVDHRKDEAYSEWFTVAEQYNKFIEDGWKNVPEDYFISPEDVYDEE
ncbi:MAG: hypothetical protein ACI4II_09325 [Acutalibacteraceae bacterium]